MKLGKYIYSGCCIALLLSACTKDAGDVATVENIEAPVFYASFEELGTKTYLDDARVMHWNADDSISVFSSSINEKYRFTGETGDISGVFKKDSAALATGADKLDANYAVYPYNESTCISEDGTITFTIPSTQIYKENTFGDGAAIMIAKSESAEDKGLKFKNVCGFITVNLYGDAEISSLTLSGNDDEIIAGTMKAKIVDNSVKAEFDAQSSSSKEITLKCENVKLNSSQDSPTTFYFVVPPVTFNKGFKVKVGENCTLYSNKERSITANIINDTSPKEYSCDATIIYDAPDKLPNLEAGSKYYGHYIVDHSMFYEPNRQYKILLASGLDTIGGFKSSGIIYIRIPSTVTRIDDYAFQDCNLSGGWGGIPENVTSIGEYAFSGCDQIAGPLSIPQSVESIGSNTSGQINFDRF